MEFKRSIALRTKYFFVVMLTHRNYTGAMKFDHQQQTLDMWVRRRKKPRVVMGASGHNSQSFRSEAVFSGCKKLWVPTHDLVSYCVLCLDHHSLKSSAI
jgi:hypothetical protein